MNRWFSIFILVFMFGVITFQFGDMMGDKKTDARLDKLEAASTVAQHPQERHLFESFKEDSMWVLTDCDTAIFFNEHGMRRHIEFYYRSK